MLRCPACKTAVEDQVLLCPNPNCGYKRKLKNLRRSFFCTFGVVAVINMALFGGLMPHGAWTYCGNELRQDTAITLAVCLFVWKYPLAIPFFS